MKLTVMALLIATAMGSQYALAAGGDRGDSGTGTRDGGNIPDWRELVPQEVLTVRTLRPLTGNNATQYDCHYVLESLGYSDREIRRVTRRSAWSSNEKSGAGSPGWSMARCYRGFGTESVR